MQAVLRGRKKSTQYSHLTPAGRSLEENYTTSVQAKIICNEYFGVRYLRPATTTVP